MGIASCRFNSFDKSPQPDALPQIQKFILNYAAVSVCTPESQSLFVVLWTATCLCELRICKMQEIEVGHTKIQKKTNHGTYRVNSLTVAQRGWLKFTGALPQNHMTCKKALPDMQFWHVTRRWCCHSHRVTQRFWRNAGRIRKSQAVTCAPPLPAQFHNQRATVWRQLKSSTVAH